MTQLDPNEQHRSDAENEIPIEGAPSLSGPSPEATARTAAAALVEELEVEIRNQPVSQAEARDLAFAVLRLIRANAARMTKQGAERVTKLLRENVSSDYLDPDFWRGVGMIVQYQVEELKGLIRRRLRGEYTTDAYGMDQEVIDLVRPFASFLYRSWFRVTAEGLEHVPATGRALLAANRSGMLPWDSAMLATAILEEHSEPRVLRNMYPGWFGTMPLLAPALMALGQVQDLPENAIRLLNEDQLVSIYPEGMAGLGKLFKDRSRLVPFHDGFVQVALRTGAPLVPVAIIGGEESYPLLANIEPIARFLRLPFFPITPFFPWLGPLGVLPLPVKWTIVFHAPIATAEYGSQAADNPQTVVALSEQVRKVIQDTLKERNKGRLLG